MDINQKLRKYYLMALEESLGDKILLPHRDTLWVMDDLYRTWYLQIENNGNIFYNQKEFDTIFNVFSLKGREYSPIITSYVNDLLEFQSTSIARKNGVYNYMIDEVISKSSNPNYGWTLQERYGFSYRTVKKYLDLKKVCKYRVEVRDYFPGLLINE